MNQVLVLLLGLYLTYADGGLIGGDSHDYVPHGNVTEEADSEAEGGDTENNMLGGETDDKGCLTSGGYTWCEQLSKCLRTFEEECTSNLPPILGPDASSDDSESTFGGDEDIMTHGETLLGGDQDENGCLGSAGYTWCEKKKSCVRSWELEGEWDDECGTEATSSSDTSGESSSEGVEEKIDNFFYNDDGSIKPWVFQCFLGLSITATFLLLCLIRVRRNRKRRRQRTRTAGVMLVEQKGNYERFSSDADFVFQETVAVKNTTKDAVPNRKDFANLV